MLSLGDPIPTELAERAGEWLQRGVGCMIGRVHYGAGRFAIGCASKKSDLDRIRDELGEALAEREILSCLIIIEPDNTALTEISIDRLVRYLNDQYFADPVSSGTRRLNEGNALGYSLSYTIQCPITGFPTKFFDFDQVAFYPQADRREDPLYDPSMVAPFVCINVTSDIYGFTLTVHDIKTRRPEMSENFAELSPVQREEIYQLALKRYQRLARSTISYYEKHTDPEIIEPIHVTGDSKYYIAPHDEGAFTETAKGRFRNEMPTLYVPRIIEQWENYFEHGSPPDMTHVYSPAVPMD